MTMKRIAGAFAALGLLTMSSAASAAITVSATEIDNLYGTDASPPSSDLLFGQTMLLDFDTILNPLVSYTGNVVLGPQQGCCTASPPYNGSLSGDNTNYASVQANPAPSGLFSVASGYALKSFSFYLGSPDTYNTIRFFNGATQLAAFSGNDIWDDPNIGNANGARTWGYRIYYDFGGANVTSIAFESTQNAFEFDGLGGTVGVVPEPATWAMMIMGFGAAGAMLRRRRTAIA
jgi:hypothetical protein